MNASQKPRAEGELGVYCLPSPALLDEWGHWDSERISIFFILGFYSFKKPLDILDYLICHSLWLWETKHWGFLLGLSGIHCEHPWLWTGLVPLTAGFCPPCLAPWLTEGLPGLPRHWAGIRFTSRSYIIITVHLPIKPSLFLCSRMWKQNGLLWYEANNSSHLDST